MEEQSGLPFSGMAPDPCKFPGFSALLLEKEAARGAGAGRIPEEKRINWLIGGCSQGAFDGKPVRWCILFRVSVKKPGDVAIPVNNKRAIAEKVVGRGDAGERQKPGCN